jgi:glycosyltransferase involved in cell wall biosynthesis
MRVLLVGSRLLPYRHAGDKNFWLDLIDRLLHVGWEFQVLSVTLEDVPASTRYSCRYLKPVPMFPPSRTSLFNEDSEGLRGTNNYTSKAVTFPKILVTLRKMNHDFHPDIIHFLDNYGPVMLALRPFFPSMPLAISAPTYDRSRALYDLMLRESFRSFDRIVPFTHAYGNRLREIGVPVSRMQHIPWGVDTSRFRPATEDERRQARSQLGLAEDDLVVMWTGFTQQTTLRDLGFAVEVSRRALESGTHGLSFVFCFKPEHFKEGYRDLGRPGIHVHGSAESFDLARRAADALMSPFLSPNAIVGPPLTWLEFMAMGIPVVSTPALGIDEAIVSNQTGILESSVDEMAVAILSLRASPERLRELSAGARNLVVGRYTVERAAREYAELWSNLVRERQRTAPTKG